jgi:hypothetical protein
LCPSTKSNNPQLVGSSKATSKAASHHFSPPNSSSHSPTPILVKFWHADTPANTIVYFTNAQMPGDVHTVRGVLLAFLNMLSNGSILNMLFSVSVPATLSILFSVNTLIVLSFRSMLAVLLFLETRMILNEIFHGRQIMFIQAILALWFRQSPTTQSHSQSLFLTIIARNF